MKNMTKNLTNYHIYLRIGIDCNEPAIINNKLRLYINLPDLFVH